MHDESKFKAAVFATPAADADTAALRAYATCIFRAIFADDIAFKLSVGDKYKGSEHQPAPLNFDALMGESAGESLPDAVAEQQRIRSVADCARLFVQCVAAIWRTRRSEFEDCAPADGAAAAGQGEEGAVAANDSDVQRGLVWDKDVALDLDFATAASNLWASVFSITPRKSPWEVKSIAGNISASRNPSLHFTLPALCCLARAGC